jgi:hypothetical protein
MKAIFIKILLQCLIVTISYGQNDEKTEGQILFDDILEFYYGKDYDSALLLSHDFLVSQQNSDLLPRVKYNMGYMYLEIGDEVNSIMIFEEILNSKFNDEEDFGGLMEQYALYKHRSAKNLAEIYLNRKDYANAIKYIRLFDKKYKYKHFCGNELSANKIFTSYSYARYFNGVGENEKALKVLIPHLFYNGLANNDYLVELLEQVLEESYSKEELTHQIEASKQSLMIDRKGRAFIDFCGYRIRVYAESLFSLGNPDFEKNLDLSQTQLFNKAVETHLLFVKYK